MRPAAELNVSETVPTAASPLGRGWHAGDPRWLLVGVLVAYAVLEAVLVWHHEPWRDEADAWLVVRDTDLTGVLRLTAYMGTPVLWYLVLELPAAMGLPYFSQAVLNLVIATAAVGIFLFLAPFPLWFRVLFAFSYFPAYEYSVIARSYALGMLLLWVAAALHPQRHSRPIVHALVVAALANVNVYGLIFAGVVAALYAWEARRHSSAAGRVAGLILAGGLGAAVLQLWPPVDGQFPRFMHGMNWDAIRLALASPLVPMTRGMGLSAPHAYLAAALVLFSAALWGSRRARPRVRALGCAALGGALALPLLRWPPGTAAALPVVLGLIVLVIVAVGLSDRPRALLALAAGLGGLAYVYVFVQGTSVRHLGQVLLWYLFCLWISRSSPRAPATPGAVPGRPQALRAAAEAATPSAIALGLAVSCALAGQAWRLEVSDAFSGATEAAAFLTDQGLACRPIIAERAPHTSAVLAHLPRRTFYYAGEARHGSHMTWDAAYRRGLERPVDQAIAAALARFSSHSGVLVLLNTPLRSPESHQLRLLHATRRPVFGHGNERFHLYEVASGPPPDGHAAASSACK